MHLKLTLSTPNIHAHILHLVLLLLTYTVPTLPLTEQLLETQRELAGVYETKSALGEGSLSPRR